MEYILQGQKFEVLDRQMGDTGKDWYKIRLYGQLCWISSGLVIVDGNKEGTAYDVPIIP